MSTLNSRTVEQKNNRRNIRMKARHATLLLFLTVFPTLLLISSTNSTSFAPRTASAVTVAPTAFEAINVDGDVSLSEAQNRMYWNPHSTGFTNASSWTVTFNNETIITLKTVTGEAGHVAAGAWWACNFKSKARIPLYAKKPQTVLASFRVDIVSVKCEEGGEWLRMALACAVKRADGSVVYTELDFWDSQSALRHPSGNIGSGGNVVYKGGDVVEYKVAQIPVGQWTNYSSDLTQYINSAWSLKPSDSLESVYAVIESIGPVAVTLKIDNLWISLIN